MKHATSSFCVSGRNRGLLKLFSVRFLSVLLLLLLVSVKSWGQTTIASQDFESTPATPTWTYSTTNIGTPSTSGNVCRLYSMKHTVIIYQFLHTIYQTN